MRKQYSHRIKEELAGVIIFMICIWVVFLFDQFLPLEKLALIPRQIHALPGILAMPFLHANWSHIISNSIPLIVLLVLLAGSKANSTVVVAIIMVLGGILHWLFGREFAVVGQSGLVFGLIAFLLLSGLLERRFIPLLISLFVGVTYGSTLIVGVLPNQPGVSWDGHLFGAIAGALTAWSLTRS